jgi:hypothetical protein
MVSAPAPTPNPSVDADEYMRLQTENEALERAEEECAADEGARKLARDRATARRAELDQEYVRRFAGRVRELYPNCPADREYLIAEHACRKYSGRVGRSAAAKALDEEAVRLAVTAHVRHAETSYDDLLLQGIEREDARERVYRKVYEVLNRWKNGGVQPG